MNARFTSPLAAPVRAKPYPHFVIHYVDGFHRVRIVDGPVVAETDDVEYPNYTEACAALLGMEEAEDAARMLAVPCHEIPLSEEQARWADQADIEAMEADGFFPEEDE